MKEYREGIIEGRTGSFIIDKTSFDDIDNYRKANGFSRSKVAREALYYFFLKQVAIRNSIKRRERMKIAREKGSHKLWQWNRLLEECGNCCVACGDKSKKVTKDHILPIADGGSDLIENIQPLCLSCNVGNTQCHNYLEIYRLKKKNRVIHS